MNSSINDQAWQYVEKLYIHCYELDGFLKFIKSKNVELPAGIFDNFEIYRLMSTDNHDFAEFMRSISIYKCLPILSEVIFDVKIQSTQSSSWNYYGTSIKNWYPQLKDQINRAGFIIDNVNKEIYPKDDIIPNLRRQELIEVDFSDPFLNHIKKEINECYIEEHYLAVMILSRKLAECLIVRLMERVFPKYQNNIYSSQNHSLLCDIGKNYRIHDLSILLENIKDNSSAFHEDEDLVKDTCSLVKPFKNETNKMVHKDYKNPIKENVDIWDISRMMGMLWKLYKKYC
jgi:hypothetical protein